MLKAVRIRTYGFMPLYPAPFMTTPSQWLGLLVGPGIASKARALSKHLCIYIILWGMWGDIVISLMQRGFTAPHVRFFIGEIPHKKWGAEKLQNQVSKAVPHKECGELPTATAAASLAMRGLSAYLPNSPRFITTYTTIQYLAWVLPAELPSAGNSNPAFFEFLCLYRSRLHAHEYLVIV
jgi:hypothetical protein